MNLGKIHLYRGFHLGRNIFFDELSDYQLIDIKSSFLLIILLLTWTTTKIYFPCVKQQPPSRREPPHYRGFTIILRHTTLGRTSLDERSARHRDLYLTTHNTHNRQTSMPSARFEPAIPEGERTQIHALDSTASRTKGPATQNAVCRSGLRSLSAAECYILSRLF